MKTSAEALLLDTHVWIWLVRAEDRIPRDVLELVLVAANGRKNPPTRTHVRVPAC